MVWEGGVRNGNIHFADCGAVTLFDFDCFGYGWRAYDLAVFLWHQQLNPPPSETRDTKARQREAFLSGYTELRPLGRKELTGVECLVLRDVWLHGLHLGSLQRNRGRDWVTAGYFDFP